MLYNPPILPMHYDLGSGRVLDAVHGHCDSFPLGREGLGSLAFLLNRPAAIGVEYM